VEIPLTTPEIVETTAEIPLTTPEIVETTEFVTAEVTTP